MNEKKALYFDAGAREVWFCRQDGTMEFFQPADGPAQPHSALCPASPLLIEA